MINKLDIRTVDRRTLYQTTCENVYDVAMDYRDDDAVIELSKEMIAACLSEDPTLLRELLETGNRNGMMMLPDSIVSDLIEGDESLIQRMIIVVLDDDGVPFLTMNAVDIDM